MIWLTVIDYNGVNRSLGRVVKRHSDMPRFVAFDIRCALRDLDDAKSDEFLV